MSAASTGCAHQPCTACTTIALAGPDRMLYVASPPQMLFPHQDTCFIRQAESREDTSFVYLADRLNQLATNRARPIPRSSRLGLCRPTLQSVRERPPRSRSSSPFSQTRRLCRPGHRAPAASRMARCRRQTLYRRRPQDLTFGGRRTRTPVSITLTSSDQPCSITGRRSSKAAPAAASAIQAVATDQHIASRHLAVEVDRDTAPRDWAFRCRRSTRLLYDVLRKREVATIYSRLPQYKVLLEARRISNPHPWPVAHSTSPAQRMQVPLRRRNLRQSRSRR